MLEVLELNDDNFNDEINEREVSVVVFYAKWCGSCRMATPMFKNVLGEYNLPLMKIDIESNPQIKEMLELEGLPTIGIFKKGEPVAAINTTKEDVYRDFLKEHQVEVQ